MKRAGLSRVWAVALSLWWLCCPAPRVLAQNFRGGLLGTVEDQTGARVPNASVSVQAAEASLVQRETTSDGDGQFRVDDLLPGVYHLSVKAKGFADASSNMAVVVATVKEVTVTLHPAAMSQTVNVEGAGIVDRDAADRHDERGASDGRRVPGPGNDSSGSAQLRQHRLSRAGDRASGTVRSDEGAHHGSVDGRKLRAEQRAVGGRRRQLGRLHRRLPAEFLAGRGSGICGAHGGRRCGHGPHDGGIRGDHHEARHQRLAWRRAFYDRQAALNARFPIENPAPNPKQPFSRQNYVGTVGGPIVRDKVWFFSSLEYVHENASIAYSPTSQTQFNALAQLAQMGLVDVNGTVVSSIPTPNIVPVPFRDYLASTRFDWAQSARSQWFLRAAADNYLTHNALVAQAALPSTGVEQHNNYMNMVISNQFTFSPTWLGSFVFDASGLHLTAARNSDLGFALAFPFTATSATISGFETFGDNQFITPITAFPVLRNQEKYQFRYDVTHTTGAHSIRFGVNFIHEPVLSGALTSNRETIVTFCGGPDGLFGRSDAVHRRSIAVHGESFAEREPGVVVRDDAGGERQLRAEHSAARALRRGFVARHAAADGELRLSLRPELRVVHRVGAEPVGKSRIPDVEGVADSPVEWRAARFHRGGWAAAGNSLWAGPIRKHGDSRRAGIYSNDLAQNGWVPALQAVNTPPGVCVNPGDPGCLPPAASTGPIGTWRARVRLSRRVTKRRMRCM